MLIERSTHFRGLLLLLGSLSGRHSVVDCVAIAYARTICVENSPEYMEGDYITAVYRGNGLVIIIIKKNILYREKYHADRTFIQSMPLSQCVSHEFSVETDFLSLSFENTEQYVAMKFYFIKRGLTATETLETLTQNVK